MEAEVVDPLTISPLDRETLAQSVARTGRAVVVHEAPKSFGPGAEIAASIMDGAFLSLQAPIARSRGTTSRSSDSRGSRRTFPTWLAC